MYKITLLIFSLVVFGIPAQAVQTCVIKYLGRDADHILPGDPAGIVIPPGDTRYVYHGHKQGEDEYNNPNIWEVIIPTDFASDDTIGPALDVFEFTCTE